MLDLGRTLLYVTEREPSAIAVIDGETTLTYGAWLDRALRTVAGLDALGLGRGDHLVAILQNRLEAATLHWACQIAGVAITPVNWRAKPEELDYVLDDAGARAVCFEPVSADAVVNASHAREIPRIAVGGAGGGTAGFDDLAGGAPRMRHQGPVRTTSRSCSTPPAPRGARRGSREPTPPSARPPSRTSRRTATATASAPWG